MPQFFVDTSLAASKHVEIRGADARHILQSLRLGQGDWMVLSDGKGRSFRAVIRQAKAMSVILDIIEEITRVDPNPPPALAIASIRAERMEWAIQKSVELGCRRILPFNSARTVRKAEHAGSSRKIERLRKIALEAAKQSGLPFVPSVEKAIDFLLLCSRLTEFKPALLLYEGEAALSIRKALADADLSREGIIIIGPEGGFTDEEVDQARGKGALTASLGRQILKAETAAVAAVAIYQYESGNTETV
ncbi:MAG: RsmE family RNA methyltransferase [bacterium]